MGTNTLCIIIITKLEVSKNTPVSEIQMLPDCTKSGPHLHSPVNESQAVLVSTHVLDGKVQVSPIFAVK